MILPVLCLGSGVLAQEAADRNNQKYAFPKWEDLTPQEAILPEKYADKQFKTVDLSKYGLPVTAQVLTTMEVDASSKASKVTIIDTTDDRLSIRIEFGKPSFRNLLKQLDEKITRAATSSRDTAVQRLRRMKFFRFENPSALVVSTFDPREDYGTYHDVWGTLAAGKFNYKMTFGISEVDTSDIDEVSLALHILRSFKPTSSPQRTDLEELGARGVLVGHLKDPYEIKHLTIIPSKGFTEAGYECLAPLTNLEKVNHVFSPASDALLFALKDKKKLQTLIVPNGDITDDGLAYLSDLPKLTSLNLRDTLITDEGLKHLSKIKTLTELNLTGTQITGLGLTQIAELAALEQLDLGSTRIKDTDLHQLANFAHLKEVKLHDLKLTGEGLQDLAALKELSFLDLSQNPNLRSEAFASLGRLPKLQTLVLVESHVSLQALTLLNASTVETLVLRNSRLIDNQLFHLKHFEKLKSLYLDGCNQLNGSGLVHLKEIPTLETLTLPRNITPEALKEIEEMKNLKYLSMNSYKSVSKESGFFQNSDVEALKQARPDLKIW